jgi:hypothetical protein
LRARGHPPVGRDRVACWESGQDVDLNPFRDGAQAGAPVLRYRRTTTSHRRSDWIFDLPMLGEQAGDLVGIQTGQRIEIRP